MPLTPHRLRCLGSFARSKWLLAVIKCIYLPPTYLYFIQDIEDRCLLLTSSTSFIDLPFQEHRMTEKHHMDQNLYISSLCPKPGIVTDNMTSGSLEHQLQPMHRLNHLPINILLLLLAESEV
jgi:hypothetical protein